MLRNNIVLAIRNITRNKAYSLLNITGIALGTAAFLLILQFVSREKSFNSFHKELHQLHRLVYTSPDGNSWPEMEPGIGPLIKEHFPQIQDFCRYESGIAQGVVKINDPGADPFRETGIGYADGNFFSFFSFPLLAGKAADLEHPFTVFVSNKTAKKYFGNKSPIGQSILLYNQFGEGTFRVAGIYDIPDNSDIQYDMVFSLATLAVPSYVKDNDWAAIGNLSSQYIQTMVNLSPGTDLTHLEKQLNELRHSKIPEQDGTKLHLQKMSAMHLPDSFNDPFPSFGNLKYVYVLGLVAILIVFMAWFNYVNLSTAQALKRANEIGIRKIIGASRASLIQLYLTEAMLMNLLGAGLALLLVLFIQPVFNNLIQQELTLTSIKWNNITITGIGILLTGAVLSGWYTAMVITGYQPLTVLKNKSIGSSKSSVVRKYLVVAQFAISIGLVLSTFIIYKQLQYMQDSALGMTIDKLLVVRGPSVGKDSSYANRKSAFITGLESNPQVQQFSLTGSVPGSYYNFRTAGFSQPGSNKGVEQKSFAFAIVDHRYLPTYSIDLVAGRNFTPSETSVEWNQNDKVMLNERAVKELGFKSAEEAISTRISWDERSLQVLGVVKNYHHTGLQNAIDPIIFYPQTNNVYYSIRLVSGRIQEQIAKLETLFKQSFPNNPFEYFFADEQFNRQYIAESKYGALFTTASFWAILIACLGLFGLTTYSIRARTREIGIRKVLGASVSDITTLLSLDFIKLVLVAGLIACPLAWWGMQNWLTNFAYKIEIPWWLLPFAVLVALFIAVGTISIQTIKTALSNPIKALKTD
ncbi:ABC transporter permease [Flavihumibacter sp. UBA7668]|uniref:ABC transporter permease n=1 Tax=Flavihumibacter sp. UBA7668 TaxID=1946542 RepID=UPI0025BD99E0|nr:ABC transporter permease [Flavihumibacter sp. UBA7668]